MFDILKPYTRKGHFIFNVTENLSGVCNAPDNVGGVYIVYDNTTPEKELIYIGRSGKIKKDGTMHIRKDGIRGRLVKGIHEFPAPPKRSARRVAWPLQMKFEGIRSLYIEWFVTLDNNLTDCPEIIERTLINKHIEFYGKMPRWNKQ